MDFLQRLGENSKAQAAWRFELEDGDHLVDARIVGTDKIQINVDGMQAVKLKMDREKAFPFRVGNHLASMTVETKWNSIAIGAGILAAILFFGALGSGGGETLCMAILLAGVPLWIAGKNLGKEFKLVIEGREVPQGIRSVIAQKVVQAAQPQLQPQEIHVYQDVVHSSQPPVAAPAPPPVVPVLPARCDSCGQPLSMDNARWSGPLNARCPSCGAAVEVMWKELGASGR